MTMPPKTEIHTDDDDDDEYDTEDEETITELTKDDDTSDTKQHVIAILIAVIASAVTFYHTNNSTSLAPTFWTMNRNVFGDGSIKPHHAAYRRTAGLFFCQNDDNVTKVRAGLEPFDFRVPKKLVPTMLRYYDEDDEAYKELFEGEDGDAELEAQRACLEEMEHGTAKSFVSGIAGAFVAPDIATYYQLARPKSERPGKKITKASLTFTGFAAKFYNLSPKPLVLYWDGGSGKNKERK
eukprot:CAMPEP_0172511870 /NCGR_PEP_ID=MMETSP1066-20121228/239926_1 /TAXON_ID=671091 /ORGANISM="Coscinodiscus wailesii, Strain CCMP2513" /LENGTH=237 /DNA_ID=CAMNT_0013291433 /DNA_START=70 /DNA_END=780 /DNA_ORIENTATION=+